MASIENIDLSQEIESWKSAVYGKDVRAANVAAFEKIQGTVNDTVQNVNQAAEDSASAAHNAQAAVDSIQAAIVTATEKAAAAATSATQAAGSQEAADSKDCRCSVGNRCDYCKNGGRSGQRRNRTHCRIRRYSRQRQGDRYLWTCG